jgi:hypothetical protein
MVAGNKVVPFPDTKISHASIPVMTEISVNGTVVFRIFFLIYTKLVQN